MMISKICMVMAIIAMVIPCYAQGNNYFTEGTEWIYRMTATSPPRTVVNYRATLEGEKEVGGYAAVGYWEEDLTNKRDKRLYTYIRTEESKVYFLVNEETAEWKLLYDFGLQPGETTTVWMFNGMISYGPLSPFGRLVACVGVTSTSDFHPDMREMKMRRYWSEQDFVEDPNHFSGEGIWIDGIGSLEYPMWSAWWQPDGVISEMLEISHKGEVLYRAPGYTGVSYTEVEIPNVQLENGTIRIQVLPRETIKVVSAEGKLMHGEQGVYTDLPAGVYYVVKGSATKSVIVP